MIITDALVMEVGRVLDELPHNTPNWDKARAVLAVAVRVMEDVTQIAENQNLSISGFETCCAARDFVAKHK